MVAKLKVMLIVIKTKWINYIILLLFLLVSFTSIIGQNLEHYQMLNPRPNATLINPQTDISIRQGEILSKTDIEGLDFQILGSNGKEYTFDVILAQDQKTIVLKLLKDFLLGDEIMVSLKDSNHSTLKDFVYTFNVQEKTVPVSKKRSLLWEQSEWYGITNEFKLTTQAGIPEVDITLLGEVAEGELLFDYFFAPPALYPNEEAHVLSLEENSTETNVLYSHATTCLNLEFQNGYYTFFAVDTSTILPDGNYGAYHAMNENGAIVDTFICGNGYITDTHDFQITEEETFIITSYDVQEVDMSQVVEGGNSNALVTGFVVQELDMDRNVLFEWRSWDYFNITDAISVADSLEYGPFYLTVAEDFTAEAIDYAHGNAVEVDQDGNLILSLRNMTEVSKINRETGDIMWRLNGKNNEFEMLSDIEGSLAEFSDIHDVRRTEAGTITLFDNGSLTTPVRSRALEFEIDEVNKTCTLVWEYVHPENFWSVAMGGVQRLPNGNTLIGWGLDGFPFVTENMPSILPRISEVSPEGELLMEVSFGVPEVVTYRARKYAKQDSIMSSLNSLAILEKEHKQEILIHPNPTPDFLNLQINSKESTKIVLKIVNVIGVEQHEQIIELEKGNNKTTLDVSTLPKGMYFTMIYKDNVLQESVKFEKL